MLTWSEAFSWVMVVMTIDLINEPTPKWSLSNVLPSTIGWHSNSAKLVSILAAVACYTSCVFGDTRKCSQDSFLKLMLNWFLSPFACICSCWYCKTCWQTSLLSRGATSCFFCLAPLGRGWLLSYLVQRSEYALLRWFGRTCCHFLNSYEILALISESPAQMGLTTVIVTVFLS